MGKYKSMAAAEKCFNKLQGKPCFQGRTYSEEEITEAWLECQQKFDEQKNKPKSGGDGQSNSDVIVRQIVRKCDNASQAEKYFELLHRNVGKENSLGRIFTEEDVTEAWM